MPRTTTTPVGVGVGVEEDEGELDVGSLGSLELRAFPHELLEQSMAHTVDVNSGLQRKQFLHNQTAGSAGHA